MNYAGRSGFPKPPCIKESIILPLAALMKLTDGDPQARGPLNTVKDILNTKGFFFRPPSPQSMVFYFAG
jgi:hypothetical protein